MTEEKRFHLFGYIPIDLKAKLKQLSVYKHTNEKKLIETAIEKYVSRLPNNYFWYHDYLRNERKMSKKATLNAMLDIKHYEMIKKKVEEIKEYSRQKYDFSPRTPYIWIIHAVLEKLVEEETQ